MTRPASPAFGLCFDLRNPPQWRKPPARSMSEALDLVASAEAAGADAVWVTEHHFFGDGYLAQPLTFLAAAAARTTRVRLGTAVTLAPLQHPRHIAEQAALIDLLSDGRMELGLGAGYVPAEFEAFGADISRRFSTTDQACREIARLLGGPQGEELHEDMSLERVQPQVPIWLGYQGVQNARRAGRLGVGLLSLKAQAYESYLSGLAEGDSPAPPPRLAGGLDVIVARDPERAWALLRPHYEHQLVSYLRAHGQVDAEVSAGALQSRFGSSRPAGLSVTLSVLDPAEAVEAIVAKLAGLPVHHAFTWASIAGMPSDLCIEHQALFFGEVVPLVRARLAALENAGVTE